MAFGSCMLVHGGWHWSEVEPRLRAAGLDTHVPTLTGLGDRAREATPETGLTSHVEDVVVDASQEEMFELVRSLADVLLPDERAFLGTYRMFVSDERLQKGGLNEPLPDGKRVTHD